MQCWEGDDPKDCQLPLFADASFAAWLGDSESTSGCFLVLMGPNTFVPLSWFSKKQGSIRNSSTESELISLDAALRVEGIPALAFWEHVIDVFHPIAPVSGSKTPLGSSNKRFETSNINEQPPIFDIYDELASVDYVPPNIEKPNGKARLVLLEDNDPDIQICIKGRNPKLRHVQRIHRVNIGAAYGA